MESQQVTRRGPVDTSVTDYSSPSPPRGQSGAKIVEHQLSGEEGYLDQLSVYLPSVQGIASYVRKGLQEVAPMKIESPGQTRDTVLSVHLQRIIDPLSKREEVFLHICYADGLQVWNTTDVDHIKEVLSLRQEAVKIAKFLPYPTQRAKTSEQLHDIWKAAPLLLSVAAAESRTGSAKAISVYSLPENRYIHELRLPSEVLGLEVNGSALVAVLRDHIYVFRSCNLEMVNKLDCAANSRKNVIASLGSRWLAYATVKEPFPAENGGDGFHLEGMAPSSSSSPTNGEENGLSIKEMAQGVANSLYYLGKLGKQQLGGGKSNPVLGAKGLVGVVDPIKGKCIFHFEAHAAPLSSLAFDSSGVLVAAAPIEGQTIHVYRLLPQPDKQSQPRLIYRLIRGITHANIRVLSFSADSKWLAALTSNGTAHLFAINPAGGQVDATSHVPGLDGHGGSAVQKDPTLKSIIGERKKEMALRLSAVGRFRHQAVSSCIGLDAMTSPGTSQADEAIAPTLPLALSGIFCGRAVLVANQAGSMSLFQVRPAARRQGDSTSSTSGKDDSSAHKLELLNSKRRLWDMCRRRSWGEVRCRQKLMPGLTSPAVVGGLSESKEWLPVGEMTLHPPVVVPLWMQPRTAFRVYRPAGGYLRNRSKSCNIIPLYLDDVATEPLRIMRTLTGTPLGITGADADTSEAPVGGLNASGRLISPMLLAMSEKEVEMQALQLSQSISLAVSSPLQSRRTDIKEIRCETPEEQSTEWHLGAASVIAAMKQEYFSVEGSQEESSQLQERVEESCLESVCSPSAHQPVELDATDMMSSSDGADDSFPSFEEGCNRLFVGEEIV